MSAEVHILVQFTDGKPDLTLGAGHTYKTRSFQVKGAADNYAKRIIDGQRRENEYWLRRVDLLSLDSDTEYAERQIPLALGRVRPLPDIRVLTVSIPDEGPVGEAIWPSLLGIPAVSWS